MKPHDHINQLIKMLNVPPKWDALSPAEQILAEEIKTIAMATTVLLEGAYRRTKKEHDLIPLASRKRSLSEVNIFLEKSRFPFSQPPVEKPIKEPKIKKEKPPLVVTPPYGTHGEWDHPNREWARTPTAADVDEIQRQKLLRNPKNDLWQSREKLVQWLRDKGFNL